MPICTHIKSLIFDLVATINKLFFRLWLHHFLGGLHTNSLCTICILKISFFFSWDREDNHAKKKPCCSCYAHLHAPSIVDIWFSCSFKKVVFGLWFHPSIQDFKNHYAISACSKSAIWLLGYFGPFKEIICYSSNPCLLYYESNNNI